MKLYCGIDLHSNNSFVSVINETDDLLFEKRLPNDLGTIIRALQPYQGSMTGVVVESTYNWYWLVDGRGGVRCQTGEHSGPETVYRSQVHR